MGVLVQVDSYTCVWTRRLLPHAPPALVSSSSEGGTARYACLKDQAMHVLSINGFDTVKL